VEIHFACCSKVTGLTYPPDRRDIGHPFRIGRRRRKLAVEQVRGHRLLVLAVGRSGAMLAWLASPTANCVNPSPSATTAPAMSQPRIYGRCPAVRPGTGNLRPVLSTRLIPAARTCTSTSLTCDSGRSASSYFKTSTSPNSCIRQLSLWL
jgi:hypothetical protein